MEEMGKDVQTFLSSLIMVKIYFRYLRKRYFSSDKETVKTYNHLP